MTASLILGGIRSGKSRFAEQLAATSQLPVTYVATAEAIKNDDAWQTRIQRHRDRRPTDWRCIEEPIDLASVIVAHRDDSVCLLIDCLSVWMSNLLLRDDDALMRQQQARLLDAVTRYRGELLMVSAESNMGVIPMGDLTRRYCDYIGELHQQLAAHCHKVVMIHAGLPLYLKGE